MPAITLQNVNKALGTRKILRNVNFAVEPGDIFGYLGPNGAGKTTTIKIMLGLMRATSGQVSVMGNDIQSHESRRSVGFVLEADGLYDNMTAYDNMGYYASIYGMAHPQNRIENTLKMVNLWDRAKDKISTYSKGMRQRLALARAMVHDPQVLILDEPTAGVDPTGQIEVRQILLGLAHDEGKTIFLSSHNLDEVQRICNRIALIHHGEISLYGKTSELQRDMSSGRLEIETAEPINQAMLQELINMPGIKIQGGTDNLVSLSISKDIPVWTIVDFLSQHGAKIEQIKRQEASLEEMYVTILKDSEQS